MLPVYSTMSLFRKSLFFCLFFGSLALYAQEGKIFNGRVFRAKDKQPLSGANIVNLTQITGTTTSEEGFFRIHAHPGDTLLISFLGYKNVKIPVHNDDFEQMHDYYLQEAPVSLQEIVVRHHRLTGILDVDLKLIPVQPRIKIDPHLEILFGAPTPDLYSDVVNDMRKISDPVGLLYNMFSAHGKDLRRLKKLKENDKIFLMLSKRFDRQILSDLLHIPPDKVYRMLELCDYDEKFLREASDMQILEALKACYEQHKFLLERKDLPVDGD